MGNAGARRCASSSAALWCGAMVFFAAFGARLVLHTAPSRAAGGTINRALLDALDVFSYGAVLALFALLVLSSRKEAWPRVRKAMAVRLLLVAAVATFVSHVLVTPQMVELRDRMPIAIDLVPKDDPLRQSWGRLHGFSSIALLVRVVCAAGLFLAALPRREDDRPSTTG
jgi:hypothetical protein